MAEYEFKVGDRVRATKKCTWGRTKAGDLGTVIVVKPFHRYGVEFDNENGGHECDGTGKNGYCWWVNSFEIELVHEVKFAQPEPTPEPITVNITVNLYENACWYCKEGGIVDRIFAGQLGICPCCGRLCNNIYQTTKSVKPVKSEKKDNKPLTKEELEALVDGTRVFVVFNKCEGGKWFDKPQWDDPKTCWRTKGGNELRWSNGHVSISNCGTGAWKAYLEEPKRPDFTFGDDIELPF